MNLYQKMKQLEQEIDSINLQEEFIKIEQQNLQRELIRAKEELKKIQSVPLVIGQFIKMVDDKYGLINTNNSQTLYVRVLSILDREKLKQNTTVALRKGSHAVVEILKQQADTKIQMMKVKDRVDVTFDDIGGLDQQKIELKECIELPLQRPELYT